jgi:hypothetical protein
VAGWKDERVRGNTADGTAWRRSSHCYGGDCVEAGVRRGREEVLLRDSKHPESRAIPLAFQDWPVFMDLVRNAARDESFDLVVPLTPAGC